MADTPDGFPIYNKNEPYYIYKRKLDAYFISQQQSVRNDILYLINCFFLTKYKHLTDIKKITCLPSLSHINEVLKNNSDIIKRNKIRTKNIKDVVHFINYVLGKIGFSFVKIEDEYATFYIVK